jgi:hypothetical protein
MRFLPGLWHPKGSLPLLNLFPRHISVALNPTGPITNPDMRIPRARPGFRTAARHALPQGNDEVESAARGPVIMSNAHVFRSCSVPYLVPPVCWPLRGGASTNRTISTRRICPRHAVAMYFWTSEAV